MFKIFYQEEVVKIDIPKINPVHKQRIREVIETKLTTQPEVFGKPLRKSLKAYRSLRIAEYRIIYRIEGDLVRVLLIAHRSVVYQKALKR